MFSDEIIKVRKTYPQNWAAYNASQTCEKQHFLKLLHDLCSTIEELRAAPTGKPRLPLGDALFACCFKIYSTVSGRRFMTDLRDAAEDGLISRTPHFNSIFNYLENPSLTPILRNMIIATIVCAYGPWICLLWGLIGYFLH